MPLTTEGMGSAFALTALSLALSIAGAVFLLIYPFYSDFDGSLTLIEQNGSWVLIPILLPVLVAAVPLAFPRRRMRIISSMLLGAFVVVSGLAVGSCYLAAAGAMVVAATRKNPKRDPYVTKRHHANA